MDESSAPAQGVGELRPARWFVSNAPPKDYALSSSWSVRTFDAFLSISILASVFGNSILPEIQATLALPAFGKMAKVLMLCYSVLSLTFYFQAITGYWETWRRSLVPAKCCVVGDVRWGEGAEEEG